MAKDVVKMGLLLKDVLDRPKWRCRIRGFRSLAVNGGSGNSAALTVKPVMMFCAKTLISASRRGKVAMLYSFCLG